MVVWSLVLIVGNGLTRFTGQRFAHLSPYMLVSCEGGNVALPLYISLVGTAHIMNIVVFDMAGILINFGRLPILVARATVGTVN